MIKMFYIVRNSINCRSLNVSQYVKYSTGSSSHIKIPSWEDDYTETPQYPSIERVDKVGIKEQTLKLWYDKIKRQETVEEKLFEVNVPRYWGWKSVIVKEGVIPFDNLSFVQHITRTHLIESNELPGQSKELVEKSVSLSKELKNEIEDQLWYQVECVQHKYKTKNLEVLDEEKEATTIIVDTLNRVLMKELVKKAPHVFTLQEDYKPRLEAFWSVGGMELPPEKKKEREKDEDLTEEDRAQPMDRWVQYLGTPLLQVRHKLPLPQIMEQDSALVESYPVEKFTFDPAVVGYQTERRHGTNIPGFWPGDKRDFAFLSYHSTDHLNHRPESYGEADKEEALRCQAVLASFGWLLPLACYHGFSTFHDPTYPTVTQTVLTDGRHFTLAAYQLNTTVTHAQNIETNPRANLCWVTPSAKLFNGINNGKLEGLNEDLLAKLIALYLNEPRVREGVELTPYLGTDVQRAADIEDEERRVWLEREFKHFSMNKPRHRADNVYEIYDWERIYKIDHQTRFQDARRRPFELRQKPFHRKMSDHPGVYIPRHLRPDQDLPKWRQKKFKPSFYPK